MKLNANLSRTSRVESATLPWRASPTPGVERRMIERDGDEVARCTSLVRYAPDSRFPAHTHGLGEEFIVLEGTFRDEHGAYPTGSYVRNPVGSRHSPFTREGCLILVKLRWMHPEDGERVVVDLPARDSAPGETVLHRNAHECNTVLVAPPGGGLPARTGDAGEEIYVLDGHFQDSEGEYPAGTWLRRPARPLPALTTTSGGRLYRKTGHLRLADASH